MKRIIFMGTPTFAAFILKQLLEAEQKLYEIVAVVSQPDKAIGRKRTMRKTPVKALALAYDLPILQPEKIGDIYDELVYLKPDLIISAAYGQIVPKNILDIPTDKCINVHGSLLPKYRGGAPIQHAIMAGETTTGITIMYMVEKMDAGPMLAQAAVPITKQDTLETMFETLQVLGAKLLLETLPLLFQGKIIPTPQDESQVTYAPTMKKTDCRIDWTRAAQAIFNQVRGLCPTPAAFTLLNDQQIKVYRVKPIDQQTKEKPGTIVKADKTSCYVATGEGVLAILDLQISGKKQQSIDVFMQGSGRKLFQEGARFES